MEEKDNIETTDTTVSATSTSKTQSLAVPMAIVIGFGLIAAAIFFGGTPGTSNQELANNDGNSEEAAESTGGPIRPVDENDHIRGNPNAPIVIVEYSDFDCPFCKSFHETMKRVMDNYGTNGDVAWVFRQFPLEQLHPSAPRVAAASECVAKLGGNDAFWTFADKVYEDRGVNEPTKVASMTEYATEAGVDATEFEACLEAGDTRAAVEEDYNDALNAGARGTPHSIVTVGGQEGVINGAQPYEVVSQIIDNLLTQVEQ